MMARAQALGSDLRETAWRADKPDGFWVRLLLPDLARELAPPSLQLQLHWLGRQIDLPRGRSYFQVNIFTDGSWCDPKVVGFSRAGGAAVEPGEDGGVELGCYAPLPAPMQMVPEAELFFLRIGLQHTGTGPVFDVDCADILDGLRRGRVHCTAARRPLAGVWRDLWRLLEDRAWAIWQQGKVQPDAEVLFKWVPAHRSGRDVERGLLTEAERHGNQLADAAAKQGAGLRKLHPPFVEGWQYLQGRAREAAAWVAASVTHGGGLVG